MRSDAADKSADVAPVLVSQKKARLPKQPGFSVAEAVILVAVAVAAVKAGVVDEAQLGELQCR